MKATDEELDIIVAESFKRSSLPMGWFQTFKQGYRQAEHDIQQKLIASLKSELNGLSDIEKVAYMKALKQEKEAEPTFTEKLKANNRKKIITELKREVPKELIINGKGGEA